MRDFDQEEDNLRTAVRRVLAVGHARLDDRFSALDLTRRSDLIVFFQAHHLALSSIERAASNPKTRVGRSDLENIIKGLSADLKVLKAPAPDAARPERFDDLAIDHIVLGSRLGTNILRKRWQSSGDADVLKAGTYFSLPAMADEWKAHCQDLSRMPATDQRAQILLFDVQRLFAVFEAALEACEQFPQS